jgi:ATP-binding cassette subfamily B protein
MNTESKSKAGLAGLIKLVGPDKGKMIFSGLFCIIAQGFGIVPFVLIYFIVTEIACKPPDEIDRQFIWHLVFAGIVSVVLKYIFLGLATMQAHVAAYNILYDLRVRISKKLATLPLGYFNERTIGQIKKVMLEDVEQMEIFIAHNLPECMGAFIYVVMATVVLFVFDWRLALATICVMPIGVLAQTVTVRKNKDFREKWFTANENTNAAMVQYIQGMPIIKTFSHTVESFKKYSGNVQDCAYYEDRMCEKWFLPMAIFSVAISANLLVLLPIGAMMYLVGSITLSTFTLFLLMGLGLGSPLIQFITLGSFMERNLEGQARIDAILSAEPLPEPAVGKTTRGGSVFARDVEFAYKDKKVLKGVDFEIQAGKFMALVGPSGAGKTTLARLIPRFWDVDAGSLSIGDIDIRDMKIEDLMDEITFVFQNIFLFNDSIYENLRMGKPDATQAEIEDAARVARCHDFIMGLPDGYQSVIGERGVKISGGEKQRLSIARALLKNAPILVLDEATAFIDPENEVLIQEAINELARHKTLIVIAHRLSTITGADQILVVDEGKVLARGTHRELLEASNLYKSMWHAHVSSLGWKL